jgi:hypothetical protein
MIRSSDIQDTLLLLKTQLISEFVFSMAFLPICLLLLIIRIKWVPFYQVMASPQVAEGGKGLQRCTVSANILNESRITEKGWLSIFQ